MPFFNLLLFSVIFKFNLWFARNKIRQKFFTLWQQEKPDMIIQLGNHEILTQKTGQFSSDQDLNLGLLEPKAWLLRLSCAFNFRFGFVVFAQKNGHENQFPDFASLKSNFEELFLKLLYFIVYLADVANPNWPRSSHSLHSKFNFVFWLCTSKEKLSGTQKKFCQPQV